jgi:hypothetical protein
VTTDQAWRDLAGSLPTHQDELGVGHLGAPSIAVQDVTHGAPAPAEDRGMDDHAKYAGGAC